MAMIFLAVDSNSRMSAIWLRILPTSVMQYELAILSKSILTCSSGSGKNIGRLLWQASCRYGQKVVDCCHFENAYENNNE